MTYEQRLERERKIALAARKVKEERKRVEAQRLAKLRAKWEGKL